MRLLVALVANVGNGRVVRVARAAGIGVELPDSRPVCRGAKVLVRPEFGQFTLPPWQPWTDTVRFGDLLKRFEDCPATTFSSDTLASTQSSSARLTY
jgi:hypothetical protein